MCKKKWCAVTWQDCDIVNEENLRHQNSILFDSFSFSFVGHIGPTCLHTILNYQPSPVEITHNGFYSTVEYKKKQLRHFISVQQQDETTWTSRIPELDAHASSCYRFDAKMERLGLLPLARPMVVVVRGPKGFWQVSASVPPPPRGPVARASIPPCSRGPQVDLSGALLSHPS